MERSPVLRCSDGSLVILMLYYHVVRVDNMESRRAACLDI